MSFLCALWSLDHRSICLEQKLPSSIYSHDPRDPCDIQVYTRWRRQLPEAAVDYELLHPNGTVLDRGFHITEKEMVINAHGAKVLS